MIIPIMCMVGLCFLGWVLVLKAEMNDLKREVEKLKALIKKSVGALSKTVEITPGPAPKLKK